MLDATNSRTTEAIAGQSWVLPRSGGSNWVAPTRPRVDHAGL
jgi:hypothetical protein